MKSNLKQKIAFTLAELVVAVTISSIIFLGVLNLVGETLQELGKSNRSSELIVSLNDVIHEFEVLNKSYELKNVIIDKPEGEGTDVLMLSNSGSTGGVIIGLVDPKSKRIFNSVSGYPLYSQRHIGYRTLNASEINDIVADPLEIYNLLFYQDKIFSDMYMRDFQTILFNSQTIADINLSLLLQYGKESEGIAWEDLGDDNIYKVNLNF